MACRPRLLALLSLVGVAIAGFGAAAGAGEALIQVDWANPELVQAAKAQAASGARSLGPTADDKLAKLKLPVIAFDATPGVVENTFRLGPRPATEREIASDDDNPVWYQITEHYGDVTVSIAADLRIQQQFPATYPVYKDAARGAAAQAGPAVSVFDEQNENGIEGLMAEYTVTRYGVPYTITIECSAEAKEQCHDTAQIAKDSELLKLVRANVPAP